MKDKILVTNIQRFSIHDGPGIRTTVFLKGCSLNCPWCSNPENIENVQEVYKKDGQSGIYGKYMTCEEIYDEIIKDIVYYSVNGGITFSGGEPLLQIEKMEPLLKRLSKEKIHQCAETALFVEQSKLELAMRYINLFIVDVKILQPNECARLIGGQVELYLRNVKRLLSSGIRTIFRIPLIKNYTTTGENIDLVLNFLNENRPYFVELIKGHNLGASKYMSLGKTPLMMENIENEFMEEYKAKIEQLGIRAVICEI